jgi:hypothetical protein
MGLRLKFLMFWFMLQVDPIQSCLNSKIGLPPVLKTGSSGKQITKRIAFFIRKNSESYCKSFELKKISYNAAYYN